MIRRALVAGLALASVVVAAEAAQRPRKARGWQPTLSTAVPYTASRILEVYDGEDRVVIGAAGYLQYRHQPSCVISETSGDILCAHRAGVSHSSEADQIVITRSSDMGITWSDRRTEVTAFADNVNFQEIAALGQSNGRMWLIGSDVNNTPLPATRRCWTSYSDDDGATWSAKSFNIPEPGTSFSTCGGGMGIYEASNGDLIGAAYGQDTATAPRYTSWLLRSTTAGVTWTVTATLAGTAGTTQFEEPNCGRLRGTSTHVCLIRVDNEPTSCTGAACGYVYVTRSTDDGATWSTPTIAFNGRGTPPWTELTNGVLVATTRSRGSGTYGDADEGWRGVVYYSRDQGVTWTGGSEFQHPLDGPDGPPNLTGHGYMGASLVECWPNVACVMSSQEPGVTAYSQGGLYWRYLAWEGSSPFYSDFYASDYAIRFPVGGGGYLNYGAQNTLNAATRWVLTFRWRYPYNATDLTNPTGDQVIVSRHPAGQRHLDVRVGSSQRLFVYVGATLSTFALWTSASLSSQMTSAPWLHVVVVYDGTESTNATRLRTYVQSVEITGGGSYSGTIPASMTSPTTAVWQLGANAGSNTARGAVDDVALWTGVECEASCVAQLYANGAPGDLRTTMLGSPAVYIDGEDSTFTDRMSNWGTPTNTGGVSRTQRSGAVRYGEIADVVWPSIGRLMPTPAGDAYTPSEGVQSWFAESRTIYGFDSAIASTTESTAWPRVDHQHSFAGAGVTMGMDIADPSSQVFSIADGFEVQGSIQAMASGLDAGHAGGVILNQGLGAFPFGDIALQPNTVMLGVRPATGASDLVCIAVNAAGTITSQTLAGARTDDRLDYTITAPPGGGSVSMTVRNAVTAAESQCTLSSNLPTVDLGLITHANNGGSGAVQMTAGPIVWGRGPIVGATSAQMPQAFEGEEYEPWMADIEPASLRTAYLAMIQAPATPWTFGLGSDGASGFTGRYGTREISTTGPYWNLAPTTSVGTDTALGDYVRLTSGTVAVQPAGLPLIPPDPTLTRGVIANTMIANYGFFFETETRRTGAMNTGTRGLVCGVGSGPFGDPTAEVSTFPGIAIEYDATDAPSAGLYLHHGSAVGGTTRVALLSSGGVRDDDVVYRCAILAERAGGQVGVILHRRGHGVVYSGWLSTNIPAATAPMFGETNSSPCDDSDPGPCPVVTLDVFSVRGHLRDPR